MNILYIVVTENGIIKCASDNIDSAVLRTGGDPSEVENDSFCVNLTTYNIISTTTEEWQKTLKDNDINCILEFSDKILLNHSSGDVYELPVTKIIRHIDTEETKEKWKKAFGLYNSTVRDDDFDIESMISNKED